MSAVEANRTARRAPAAVTTVVVRESGAAIRRPLALLLLVPLAYIAAAEVARSIAVLRMPWEVMYGESIIYDQAQRLLRGEPLYMPYDRPPFSVAAYTPLYYWIVGALHSLIGPGFWSGRLVSFIAGITTAGVVGYVAQRRVGDRWAGIFAALLFLALGMPGVYPMTHLPPPYPEWLDIAFPNLPWMALYKEDVLAVALSVGSIALLLHGQRRGWLVLAGLLAALAFLTKQTTIAPALAGFLWLCWQDRRGAATFAMVAGSVVLGTVVALELTTGAFLANTVFANANPFRREALLLNLNMLGLFQGGPIILAGLWLAARRRNAWTTRDVLLALYWGGTILPLVGLTKVGSNHNHWIEFAAATAILATLALWQLATTRWRELLATLVLALHLAVLIPLVDVSPLTGLDATRPDPQKVAAFDRLVERVRDEPDEVLANPLDVIVLAGRPILLEPYLFSIFQDQGLWSPVPIVAELCSGGVGLVVVNVPLEAFNPTYHDFAHWPVSVFAAMTQTMIRQSELADRFVYVPNRERLTSGEQIQACVNHFGT